MTYCPRCDSENLTTVVAGLDWLVICQDCGSLNRLTDEEMTI